MNAVSAKVAFQQLAQLEKAAHGAKLNRRQRRQGQGKLRLGQKGGSKVTMKRHFCEGDEYIGPVNGSTGSATAPTVTSYAFNPGQAATFPRASKEAVLYEKWGLAAPAKFYYKRIVSEYNANGSAGKVALQFDYNASDAPPTTMQQAYDTQPCKDGMPCDEDIHVMIDPREVNKQDSKFIRPAGLPGSADIKTYDGGNLNVLCYGQGATTAIGELRVKYRFWFDVPVLEGTGAPANNQVALFQSTSAEAGATSTVDYPLTIATATVNGLAIVNTAGSLLLPAGNYLVDVTAQATFTGNGTVFFFEVDKTTVDVLVSDPAVVFTSGTITQASLSASVFVSSNGSDTIKLICNSTFSTGACSFTGTVRIVAI